jgi:hypothetical protein
MRKKRAPGHRTFGGTVRGGLIALGLWPAAEDASGPKPCPVRLTPPSIPSWYLPEPHLECVARHQRCYGLVHQCRRPRP